MKRLLLTLTLLCSIFSSFSQVSPAEKAALLAFYNALDGPNWVSENDADLTNDWDFTGPVTNNWFGITVNASAVVEIEMYQNNFSGTLPTEVGDLVNLRVLRMESGGITGPVPFEINQLTLLQRLEFYDNQITSIDVTGNQNLEWLDMGRNLITTIDVRQNLLLTYLGLSDNQLTMLDVSQNPQLHSLAFSNNSISSIDVSSNLLLDNLRASNNLLTTLDVSNHPHLYQLIAPGNLLTSVDLTNSNIGYIYLFDNQLAALDLSSQTYLEDLSIQNNFITTIDISGASGLMGIDVSNNQLTELHLNDKDMLFVFDISHNQISNLTFTSIAPDIEDIDISFNELTDHSLVTTFLSFSNLTDLNISNNDFRGSIPDTSLLPLDLFHFDNNRYQFGDLISHQSSSSAISDYSNSPQAKLDNAETRNLPVGASTSMVTNCSGAYNTYQWYKDGVALSNGPLISGSTTDTLTLNNLTGADSGVYHCEVNSTAITGLTLYRNDITLSIGCNSLNADIPEDVVECESYSLPSLSADNYYYTDTNAGGIQLNAADLITSSQTIYVFTGTTDCFDESSFVVTIDHAVTVDSLENVTECEPYTLPILTNGNYFTESGGSGTELFANEALNTSQTVYIYFESGTCSDESSFTVTIDPSFCEEPNEESVTCKLKFPKFFTPNNDGTNDRFIIDENPCSKTGTLSIYDRYGKLMFETNILGNGWDGTLNGSQFPETDYWYQFVNAENNETVTGHFSLKR